MENSPHEYQVPSGPVNTGQTPPSWFEAAASPNIPPTPTPHKSSPIKKIILIVLLIALIATITTGIISSQIAKACFDPSQYKQLIELSAKHGAASRAPYLKPNEAFYTQEIGFEEISEEYFSASTKDTQEFIDALGKLHKDQPLTAPMSITVTTFYSDNTSALLAKKRLNKITQSLQKAGITEKIITSAKTQEVSQEDGEPDPIGLVTITPLSNCEM